jgi:hypothetical protein
MKSVPALWHYSTSLWLLEVSEIQFFDTQTIVDNP